jgi:hypothetical protein
MSSKGGGGRGGAGNVSKAATPPAKKTFADRYASFKLTNSPSGIRETKVKIMNVFIIFKNKFKIKLKNYN